MEHTSQHVESSKDTSSIHSRNSTQRTYLSKVPNTIPISSPVKMEKNNKEDIKQSNLTSLGESNVGK
jgi:hypothetical protein